MMSSMSVSMNGLEMELEPALDQVFMELQQNLNNSHCTVRSILQSEEQDCDYQAILDLCFEVHENIDGMAELFKNLNDVLKHVSKPDGDEEKALYKASMEKYKRVQAEAKAAAKATLATNKAESKEQKSN